MVSMVTWTMIGRSSLPGRRPGQLRAVDRRLDLQRVLAGLDQKAVDAAGQEAARLQGKRLFQLVVGDLAQGRQLGARPDRAEHEALALEAVGRLARQLGGPLVDLEGPVLQIELGQRERRAAEGVGLDHVGAGREVAFDGSRESGRAGSD